MAWSATGGILLALVQPLVIALALVVPLLPLQPAEPAHEGELPIAALASCRVGCRLWEETYNGPGSRRDVAVATAVDSSRAYATGWFETSFLKHEVVTLAYDLVTGAELWSATLDGSGAGVDQPAAIAVSGSTLVVVGTSEDDTAGADVLAVAYDAATGAETWRVALDGSGGSDDAGRALAIDAGVVYVAGKAWGAISASDVFVAALDLATGEEIWRVQVDGGESGVDDATDIAVRPDGSVVVAGTVDRASNDLFALALDADGNELWSARHDTGREDLANALAVGADGSVVLTGKVAAASGFDNYLTVKLGSDGAPAWNATYNGPTGWMDVATDVAVTAAAIVVTGESSSSTGYDYGTVAYDPANGSQLWVHRYNGPSNGADRAKALALSADGMTIHVTGESQASGVGYDLAVVAVDAATGAAAWTLRYNGPANLDDLGAALAVEPASGTIVTVATSRGSGTGDDQATQAISASGASLWVARHNGPASTDDYGRDVVVSPDGAIAYVAGRSVASATSYDVLALAYSVATGEVLWESRYSASSNQDWGEVMAMSPDGSRLFITGRSVATGWDYLTVALDASDGSLEWAMRYNGAASSDDFAHDIAATDSTVVVTGQSYGGAATSYDYATVAYDASTGALLWASRFNGHMNGVDYGHAVAISPDGTKVAVVGESARGTGRGIDMDAIVYDLATGALLWNATYNGPGASSDHANDVAFAPDGARVLVTGRSVGSGYDFATHAYDAATGALGWTARFSASGLPDEANAIAVTPDGARAIVTGSSWASGGNVDLLTLSYDIATGAQQWSARTIGPGSTDVAEHVVVSPDSERVYVAGYSDGQSDDWIVVAYAAATGKALWGSRTNGPGDGADYANGLAITPDGARLVVAGRVTGLGTGIDVVTQVYAALLPPTAPRDLAGVAGPAAYEVTLSWSAPADDGGKPVTGYRIYADDVLVATTAGTSATLAAPTTEGATYRVAAVNVVGEGDAASVAVTPFQLPGAPSALDGSAGPAARQATLSWSAPADDGGSPVTAYRVYRDGALVAETANPSFVDDLADNDLHMYGVSAVTAVGEGPAAEVSVLPFQFPEAPTGVEVAASGLVGETTITWSAPADDGGIAVTSYHVERVVEGAWTRIATVGSTSHVDEGLTPLTTYRYRIVAENDVGEGPRSAEACGVASPWAAELPACAVPEDGAI